MSLKKKLLCLVLCSVIVTSLGVTAWAETQTIESVSDSQQIAVQGYYETTNDTVYSVELSWGALVFKYVDGTGRWNPSTHSYEGEVSPGWYIASGNANDTNINVTNHSNAEIKVDFDVAALNGASPVITPADGFTLESAVDKSVDEAPTGLAQVSLIGTMNEKFTSPETIATITVKISAP